MAIARAVVCDTCGAIHVAGRRAARREGWGTNWADGRDYCPGCRDQYKPQVGRPVEPCPTINAYRAHKQAGEVCPVCEAYMAMCRERWNRDRRERRATRQATYEAVKAERYGITRGTETTK